MILFEIIFILFSLISYLQACVPTHIITTPHPIIPPPTTTTTTTTTTTEACCPMLSQATLPRSSPSSKSQQQCSILRRVSSTCPIDGIVVCDAADETNPSAIQIEFFDYKNNVVRVQSVSGHPASTVAVKVICIDGHWRVPISTDSSISAHIKSVSCSQSGSKGSDRGYIDGSSL